MEIHNITEDLVMKTVNDVFDEIERTKGDDGPCTCYQCRLDAACYVLNRIPARYVVSSRGVARAETETMERQQEGADVVSLVTEAVHRISKSLRPHFEHASRREGPKGPEGPVYNFPTIIGRIFNGLDFSPFVDIEATLIRDGEPVAMIDPNWQNPYRLVASSPGTFSFWPAPIMAESEGAPRKFGFMLAVSAPGFEDLRYGFEIPLASEKSASAAFSMQRTHKIQDLYLFPPGEDEES